MSLAECHTEVFADGPAAGEGLRPAEQFDAVHPSQIELLPEVPALADARRAEWTVDLPMRFAGERQVTLRVEWTGPRNAPAIWVAGGISAHRHLAANAADSEPGWWDAAIGRGRQLDPSRYRLLSFDWLGADGDLDAPIDTVDQAEAIAAVLDHLGIEQLEAFVGASYGAMVGLAFASRHPDRLLRLIALCGAHRPHPYASAFRSLQRQIVALGQLQCDERHGLSLARQLAMLSYRTPGEFGERFDQPVTLDGERALCAADGYLAACGNRYVARWSATAFLRLSESIDLHRVDPASITAPTHLLAVEQDWLAPAADLQALADAIGADAQLTRISSPYGHDAFLKESTAVDAFLRNALCCPLHSINAEAQS